MEKIKLKLNPKFAAVLAAVLCVLMSFFIIRAFLGNSLDLLKVRYAKAEEKLIYNQTLVKQKDALKKRWQDYAKYFSDPSAAQQGVWMKELLAYAKNKPFALDKLEPAGENLVFTAFHGDALKFVEFIYDRITQDPLSGIASFSFRRERPEEPWNFEFILTKVKP